MVVGGVSLFEVLLDIGFGKEGGEFVENFGALLKDWGEDIRELVDEGGVIVAYFFYYKGIGGPCFGEGDTTLCYFCQHVVSKVVDVFCLGCDFACGFHRVEVAVDDGFALLQVALIEWCWVALVCFCGFYFFEFLGMDTGYGNADATDVHNETTVAIYTNDIAFQAC